VVLAAIGAIYFGANSTQTQLLILDFVFFFSLIVLYFLCNFFWVFSYKTLLAYLSISLSISFFVYIFFFEIFL